MSRQTGRRAAIRVRPAQSADEAGWRHLWRSYCAYYDVKIPPDTTDALWQRIVDPYAPIHALVAEMAPEAYGKTELAGFANYVLHPFTWGTDLVCYLEDLFVAEHARGNGAGSALIDALKHRAKENGWPRLYWHTHEANELARSLYEKITPVDPFVRYVIKIA